jgi:hypothetical protein
MGDAVAMATFYQPCPQKSLRNDKSEGADPCAAAACIYDTHAVVSIVIVVLGLADAGLEAPVAGIIDMVAALRYPQSMDGWGRCTKPQCMPLWESLQAYSLTVQASTCIPELMHQFLYITAQSFNSQDSFCSVPLMTCGSYATRPPRAHMSHRFSPAYAGLINLRVHIINDQVACEDAARFIAPLRGLYRNVAVTRSYWDVDLGSLSRAVRWAVSFLSCALCPYAHICPVDFQLLRQKCLCW